MPANNNYSSIVFEILSDAKKHRMKKAFLPPMKIVRFPVLTVVRSVREELEIKQENPHETAHVAIKYPAVLMPEQPKNYIKARDYEFF
jgi:hypothetical protein